MNRKRKNIAFVGTLLKKMLASARFQTKTGLFAYLERDGDI